MRERIATLPNINVKDIREHYRRTHTALNMRFIIAGKIKGRKRRIIEMLENWDLKPGKRFDIPVDELHTSDPVLIRRKDASNITFGFSFVTTRRLVEKEVQAMECLNHILTGTMNSRILGQARKRGLVYGMSSCISNTCHNSSWDFDGEVNEEDAIELFELIGRELKKVLNGDIKDGDIDAAKSYALGRYQMGAQTSGQIADFYAENYFMNEEIINYKRIPDIIKSIEKKHLVALAREFKQSGIEALVAVGSCEKAFIIELSDKLKV